MMMPLTTTRNVDTAVFCVVASLVGTLFLGISSLVPWMDEWRLCEVVGHQDDALTYVAAPHNGHIIPVYKAVALLLIELTRWDGRVLLGVNLAFWFTSHLLLLMLARRHTADPLLRTVLSLMLALPCTADNLSSQFQMQFHMWTFSTATSLLALDSKRPFRAAAAALISLFCSGAGVATCLAVAASLARELLRARWHDPRRGTLQTVLVVMLVGSVLVYRALAGDVPGHPVTMPWDDPVRVLGGFLVALGAGQGQVLEPHIAFGVGAIALPLLLSLVFRFRQHEIPPAIFTCGLIGLIVPLLLSLSRVFLGVESLATSRYLELGLPGHLALIWVVVYELRRRGWHHGLARTVAFILLGCGAASIPDALAWAGEVEFRRGAALRCLSEESDPAYREWCGEVLHPNGARGAERARVVESCLSELERRWGDWGSIGVRYGISGRIQRSELSP